MLGTSGRWRFGSSWRNSLDPEDAYKTAFRLKELLAGEEDNDDVLVSLEAYLESKRAAESPQAPEPVPSAVLPNGDSALVGAARAGETANLEMLLERGMDPNERSELDGHTALIAASVSNHADVVDVLLSAGADPSVRSRGGETALTLAAAANRVEVAKMLLAHVDIDVNIKGRDGKTPLMQAGRERALRRRGRALGIRRERRYRESSREYGSRVGCRESTSGGRSAAAEGRSRPQSPGPLS